MADDGARFVQAAIQAAEDMRDTYAALLVGGPAAGLSDERIRELQERGLLPPGIDPLVGINSHGLPWATAMLLMGAWMARTHNPVTPANALRAIQGELAIRSRQGPPDDRRALPVVEAALPPVAPDATWDEPSPMTGVPEPPASAPGARVPPPAPAPAASAAPPSPPSPPLQPQSPATAAAGPPPVPPVPPVPPGGATALIPKPPDYLGPAEREAWIFARTRAGSFARGLGNQIVGEWESIAKEVWQGESPIQVPNPEKRAAYLEVIREKVAEGVAGGLTPDKVASLIGNATGDWARDLRRIARTEMQGAINAGAVITAYRMYGDEARVGVVPRPDACKNCQRVTLDADGNVRVLSMQELLANGTNVGLKAPDWKATAWPIHPNCDCRVVVVPAGYTFAGRSLRKLAA